jgi:hypothetical protein
MCFCPVWCFQHPIPPPPSLQTGDAYGTCLLRGRGMEAAEGRGAVPTLRRAFPSPVRAMNVALHGVTDGGGAGVGAGCEDGTGKISSQRSFFMLCPPIAQKLG